MAKDVLRLQKRVRDKPRLHRAETRIPYRQKHAGYRHDVPWRVSNPNGARGKGGKWGKNRFDFGIFWLGWVWFGFGFGFGLVWFGLVWFGLVCFGFGLVLVWFGLVWVKKRPNKISNRQACNNEQTCCKIIRRERVSIISGGFRSKRREGKPGNEDRGKGGKSGTEENHKKTSKHNNTGDHSKYLVGSNIVSNNGELQRLLCVPWVLFTIVPCNGR